MVFEVFESLITNLTMNFENSNSIIRFFELEACVNVGSSRAGTWRSGKNRLFTFFSSRIFISWCGLGHGNKSLGELQLFRILFFTRLRILIQLSSFYSCGVEFEYSWFAHWFTARNVSHRRCLKPHFFIFSPNLHFFFSRLKLFL